MICSEGDPVPSFQIIPDPALESAPVLTLKQGQKRAAPNLPNQSGSL
jgi:hypothetical protein